MEATRPAPLSPPVLDAAQTAKAALRRLAAARLEPTPENYARAWRQEIGEPPAGLVPAVASAAPMPASAASTASTGADDGPAIAALIERIVRGIERGSKGWTTARKKESLQRVLSGSRSDARRLQQRLQQLVASWESESAAASPEVAGGSATQPAALDAAGSASDVAAERDGDAADEGISASGSAPLEVAVRSRWHRAVDALGSTVQIAMPPQGTTQHEIAVALADAMGRFERQGGGAPIAGEIEALCREAAPVLQQRHRLVDQLGTLCAELTASLTDLAENDSWAQGQCEAMRVKIDEGLSARGVRAVSELLRETRERQGRLRDEREQARDALKGLINRMLVELDQLGSQTGHFHDSVGRYADVIERADSLESLAGAVREMVEEGRSVQGLVQQTQTRLRDEHSKAQHLTERVAELEAEMQRLSSEVSTDQLTQVANRRGLHQAFDAERARHERGGGELAVALLDIDNFKRLNDALGHGVGNEALKSLAAAVAKTLRPMDLVARYGGEEFVVLLPETAVDDAQQILSRLQRSLSGGLFLHDDKPVLVTFSAGVTRYREGERIEDALERADQALYEAKRNGKNRTCVA